MQSRVSWSQIELLSVWSSSEPREAGVLKSSRAPGRLVLSGALSVKLGRAFPAPCDWLAAYCGLVGHVASRT